MFMKVSHILGVARDILSSVKVHGCGRVADTLDKKLAKYLERPITGTADIQEAVSIWIETEATAIEKAEKVQLDELAQLDQLRGRRDDEKKKLYVIVAGVRGTIESAVGEGESSTLVGLDSGLSRVGNQVLRRYATRALARLEDPDFEPDPTVTGAKFNAEETVEELRPALERFVGTLEEVDLHKRVTEEAQRVKNDALDRLNSLLVDGSKVFEGFYNLAGERFHAERIRKNRIRSSKQPPGSGVPEDDTPEGGTPEGEPTEAENPPEETVSEADAHEVTPDSASEEASG